MEIASKVIVVTGGGNGIGRELVLHLVSKKAKVIAVDLNESYLNETMQLAADHNDKLFIHKLDITDNSEVEKFAAEVIAIHGAIDGLINNAGIIQPFVRVSALDYEAINRVMNVNFYGTLYMIKSFLPHFQTRPEAHIINVSSMGGFLPVPGQSIYGASKAAIKLLSEALYAELIDTNVKVSVVFPGAIGTNITKNSGVETPSSAKNEAASSSYKTLAPSKAAELIIEGMKKNKLRIYVGSDSKFMNLLYRFAPTYATNFISKKMKDLLAT